MTTEKKIIEFTVEGCPIQEKTEGKCLHGIHRCIYFGYIRPREYGDHAALSLCDYPAPEQEEGE